MSKSELLEIRQCDDALNIIDHHNTEESYQSAQFLFYYTADKLADSNVRPLCKRLRFYKDTNLHYDCVNNSIGGMCLQVIERR